MLWIYSVVLFFQEYSVYYFLVIRELEKLQYTYSPFSYSFPLNVFMAF